MINGCLMLTLGKKTIDEKSKRKQRVMHKQNNYVLILVFINSILNVMITIIATNNAPHAAPHAPPYAPASVGNETSSE